MIGRLIASATAASFGDLPIGSPAAKAPVLAVRPRRGNHTIVIDGKEAPMSMTPGDTEPSEPRGGTLSGSAPAPHTRANVPDNQVTFERRELDRILNLYGRMVADGEWRDYAIDFLKDRAVFSIFRRASEIPIYRIEKNPKLARRQGAYSVISATGLIMRRGHELDRVLRVFDKKLSLVAG
jgi:hypothetical protein